MKILIAEDDAETRHGLLRLLEDNDHSVISADNKEKALGFLAHWRSVDLVITDLDMGAKDDGIELLKRSVRFYPNTKFWLVSNGLTEEIILQAKGLGAERAISKSVLLQVLKETGIIT